MKIIRFIAKSFLILFGLNILFWTLILAVLQTEQGQKWTIDQLTVRLEKATQARVKIKAFHFSFPLKLQIEEAAISQDDGPLLSIENIELIGAFSPLLHGKVVFSSLIASGIVIHAPHPSSNLPTGDIGDIGEKGLPQLPFYIKFENIDIQGIQLKRSLFESLKLPKEFEQLLESEPLRLNGSLSNNPFKSTLSASLILSAEGSSSPLPFQITLGAQKGQLSLSLLIDPFKLEGIGADFPSTAVGSLDLSMAAPLQAWKNLALGLPLQNEPIHGNFTIIGELPEEDGSLFSTLLGPQTSFKGRCLVKSLDCIELSHCEIESQAIRLQGNASIASGVIDHAHFQGSIRSLSSLSSLFGKEIQGGLDFEAKAFGLLKSPTVELALNSSNILFEGVSFQNVRSAFQGSWMPLKAQGDLAFECRGIPCKASSSIESNDFNEISFPNIRIEGLNATLGGKISFFLHDFSFFGSLEGDAENLNGLSPFLEGPLEGEGKVKLQFALGGPDPQWSATFEGRSFRYKEFAASHIFFDLYSSLKKGIKPSPRPFSQIDFTLRGIETPAIALQEISGTILEGVPGSDWPFRVNGKGQWKEDFQFALDGTLHPSFEAAHIRAEHLTGNFGPYPFHLLEPFEFSKIGGALHLKGLLAMFGNAFVAGSMSADENNIESRFQINDLGLDLFQLFAPDIPLTGKASIQGHISSSLLEPKGQFEIDLSNVQIVENIFANHPSIDGKVRLTFGDMGMEIQSQLNGIGRTPLLIGGRTPYRLTLAPLGLVVDPKLPLDISLNAEGELDPYLHLFFNDTTNLSSHAQIALKLTGQMGDPKISGSIDLFDGVYESLKTGALYHDIQAHLEGDGSRIFLKKFSARDNKNGHISATGSIELDQAAQFPFEFDIHPSQIFILNSDYAQVSASGNLTFKGNQAGSKLFGELTVDEATIHLEEAVPRQIQNIEIQYFNAQEGSALPPHFEGQDHSSPLNLDVTLTAHDNIKILANHFKSDWKGSLKITGTPEGPQLNGDLHVANGEYDLKGRIFTLTQGNIHFAGPVDKKTTLYVVAAKELEGITAEIIVKGPANKPVMSFRSNPPLSQREVLSHILFNRSISDITADEGDSLSQSFFSLNSADQTSSGDDFLTRLRNNIGIDRLDFTAKSDNESKDFGLQVGKHITENVMVTVNQSMTSLSPIFAVEAKLHKNIKAQAETGVGEDTPIRMSIKWKKDY